MTKQNVAGQDTGFSSSPDQKKSWIYNKWEMAMSSEGFFFEAFTGSSKKCLVRVLQVFIGGNRDRGVNSAPHRARLTRAANIFSRLAQGLRVAFFVCCLKTVILASACHVSHLA